MHGAVSTFLAVLILSTSKSYIFRIFFKRFFGICVFGAAHGLLFSPSSSRSSAPRTRPSAASDADHPRRAPMRWTSTAASATTESSVSVSASASKKRVVATATTGSGGRGAEADHAPDTVSAPPSPPFSARIGSPRVSPFDDDDSCAA